MYYTLFIDESGDFETKKGKWVISGLLVEGKFAEIDLEFRKIYSHIPKNLGFDSLKDFHLTEFRANLGHEKALDIAKHVLSNLEVLKQKYAMVSVVNFTKSKLSEREMTYRLMMTDLLALIETVIPDDTTIDGLDLIVATRTIDGIRQTSVSDIKIDVLNNLKLSFEAGLAARGIIDLLNNKINIELHYANDLWGLVCADFIANLTYNIDNVDTKGYLKILEKENKYLLFESFGNYELRKAKIAERDGDYVLALYRFLVLSISKSNESFGENIKLSIKNILIKSLDKKSSLKAKATIEALIERLWRNYKNIDKFDDLYQMLGLLSYIMEELLQTETYKEFLHILFRIKNMLLFVCNHIGYTENAFIYIGEQEKYIPKIASNPEYFILILDYKLYEIETYINDLQFEKAVIKAKEYYTLIENYRTVWELLSNGNIDDFNYSKIYIRSIMTLQKCLIFTSTIDEEFSAILQSLDNVARYLTLSSDIGRLHNYKVMLYLKWEKPEKALEYILSDYENLTTQTLDKFDLFWFLKTVNNTKLTNYKIEIDSIIRYQVDNFNETAQGHPNDIIWREIALYEFLMGNISKSKKAIKKSKECFSVKNAAIGKHIFDTISNHEKYIQEKTLDYKRLYDYRKIIIY